MRVVVIVETPLWAQECPHLETTVCVVLSHITVSAQYTYALEARLFNTYILYLFEIFNTYSNPNIYIYIYV